jgi:hypothetical protein
VTWHQNNDYLIYQVDESTFTTRGQEERAWAPAGHPLKKPHRYMHANYVCCMAAISAQHGLRHAVYKYAAYKAVDVVEFLKRLRELDGPQAKIAVFWDNASIHKAKVTKDRAADPDIDIKLIWNLPYRPDLNGIEFFWGDVKLHYRKKVLNMKATDTLVKEQEGVVQTCVQDMITDDRARECAITGWKNIDKAEPSQSQHPQGGADPIFVSPGVGQGQQLHRDHYEMDAERQACLHEWREWEVQQQEEEKK